MLTGLIETVPRAEQAALKVVQAPAKAPGLGERLDVFAWVIALSSALHTYMHVYVRMTTKLQGLF